MIAHGEANIKAMLGGLYFEQYIFFFFQAEDGIRDKLVTGVQTCALPIYVHLRSGERDDAGRREPLDLDPREAELAEHLGGVLPEPRGRAADRRDRKSTRLNSSH